MVVMDFFYVGSMVHSETRRYASFLACGYGYASISKMERLGSLG